jgi:hypothetical protein
MTPPQEPDRGAFAATSERPAAVSLFSAQIAFPQPCPAKAGRRLCTGRSLRKLGAGSAVSYRSPPPRPSPAKGGGRHCEDWTPRATAHRRPPHRPSVGRGRGAPAALWRPAAAAAGEHWPCNAWQSGQHGECSALPTHRSPSLLHKGGEGSTVCGNGRSTPALPHKGGRQVLLSPTASQRGRTFRDVQLHSHNTLPPQRGEGRPAQADHRAGPPAVSRPPPPVRRAWGATARVGSSLISAQQASHD